MPDQPPGDLPRAQGVRDHAAARRYELDLPGGALAILDYRDHDGARWLTHAEVPPAHEGRGHASALVRGSLELARANGLRVVPVCSYVVAWMRRHPGYDDLRAGGT